MTERSFVLAQTALAALAVLGLSGQASAQILDKQTLLDRQTFWDNRDWNWCQANIPGFESPDSDIDTTYYYRWELVTKHLTYGSPNSGYSFTEFIDRPFWSGAYGSISCPAGLQLYEVRWLKDPRYAQDYARYWFRTPGAEPRRYSTWLGDSVWAVHQVHRDDGFTKELLPDLKANYEGWERTHFDPDVGLFWQTGHDDGMEININSRQTQDTVRGAPGYRPSFNSYMWADAVAIARVARLAGDGATAQRYEAKAKSLKEHLQKSLWDPDRRFFFQRYQRDEERDGHRIKAGSLTYETGKYAGNSHGRELIGYVPWQFNLPDPGYELAWSYLMDPDYFFAPFGPTTTERHDPQFLITKTCCVWSGQSWPYATTQTLVAMANLINNYRQDEVSKDDYLKLLKTYAHTQRKDGKPYIAEGANPDTGSWEGYDSYNHSEHYFHSGFTDLIITGLAGLRPRDDDRIEINPLAPDSWDYFALDDVPYHGHSVAIVWDRAGTRYRLGPGLHLVVDGQRLATSPKLGKLTATLPNAKPTVPQPRLLNFAVNNALDYFPRATASFTHELTSPAYVHDGNYWYHKLPPNRWTTEDSPNHRDWLAIDFGTKRRLRNVKLYVLDDGDRIRAPARIELEHWNGESWVPVPDQTRNPESPVGHRANVISFAPLDTDRIRAIFTHASSDRTGLTEFEAWGEGELPVKSVPGPRGNLALNPTGQEYPSVSASHTSRFDRLAMAIDGRISLRPSPHNRWTSYESPNTTDWLALDFGRDQMVGRVELHLYDDRGGVQAPSSYTIETWNGQSWVGAPDQKKIPVTPVGGRVNTVTFSPIKTQKLRVVFTHKGNARSGVSEIEVWRE
jgi:hypothetical protein